MEKSGLEIGSLYHQEPPILEGQVSMTVNKSRRF